RLARHQMHRPGDDLRGRHAWQGVPVRHRRSHDGGRMAHLPMRQPPRGQIHHLPDDNCRVAALLLWQLLLLAGEPHRRVWPVGGPVLWFYDYGCGSYTDQGYAGILWRNNSYAHPGGCTYAFYTVNSFATGLNGAGDVCGYNSFPIVWPDGANSDTMASVLSTPGFTYGQAKA